MTKTTKTHREQAAKLAHYARHPEHLSDVMPGSRYAAVRGQLRRDLRRATVDASTLAFLARYVAPDLRDRRSYGSLRACAFDLLADLGIHYVRINPADAYDFARGFTLNPA